MTWRSINSVNAAMVQWEWRSRFHLHRPTEQTCQQYKCHNYQKDRLPQCCNHIELPLNALARKTLARVFMRVMFARLYL